MNKDPLLKNRISGDGQSAGGERYFWIAFLLTLLSNQIPFQLARLLAQGKRH